MSSSLIEVQNVSKTYRLANKEVLALQEVSLSIEKGDIYGIIGSSGAGKSTLIRCLASLISPTHGKILFQGNDLALMTKKELRAHRSSMGMIFQHFNLLSSRTVAGNVSYPLEIAHMCPKEQNNRVSELLKLVGLESKKQAYPAHLSGGEKQRVGIARALATHPSVLLCDEATSALDPRTTKDILDLLKKANQTLGVTIILITHDMEVIKRICNKVAVIEGGRVIEQGAVADLFVHPQHPTTKRLIQTTAHEIPEEFFKPPSPKRKLLRLRFKGEAASEPLIAHIAKHYQVEPNILLGWIDKLQNTIIGTLIIELLGSAEGISDSLAYLSQNGVDCEVIENESR